MKPTKANSNVNNRVRAKKANEHIRIWWHFSSENTDTQNQKPPWGFESEWTRDSGGG